MKKTFQQRIAELRAEGGRVSGEMDAIIKVADDSQDGILTAEQVEQYRTHETRLSEIFGEPNDEGERTGGLIVQLEQEETRRAQQIARGQFLQSSAGRSVPPSATSDPNNPSANNPGGGSASTRIEVVELSAEQRLSDLGCIIRAVAATKGRGPEAAAVYARDVLENERVFMAMSFGNHAEGGAWVPPGYIPDLIELLRPRSVVRRMGAQGAPLVNGKLDLPKITQGASASYTGENTDITPSELRGDQLNLVRKKLTALVPVSNDLLRYSNPSANTIVRNDLVRAVAQKEDVTFIRHDGTGEAPKGMRHWALGGNIIPATPGAAPSVQQVDQELGKLILALLNSNVACMNCGWLMAPRTWNYLETLRDGNGNKAFPEVANGRLKGYPFATTTQIPSNLGTGADESEIYFGDFDEMFIAEDDRIELDASDVAAYHDGAGVVAAFSRDQTVVRIITNHDFGVRHEEAIAVMTGVEWGS